ncbi:MAG: hypothetical protein J6Y60_07245 [Treponema sp.]|nr:hypothetical protein [Treponema sp.]
MEEFEEFKKMVSSYAKAYAEFENKQKQFDFIPEKGDQKTGVIGEAYIYKYLTAKGYKDVEFGSPSEEVWDVKYKDKNRDIKIQVKTVSDFSEEKIISPIHPGFDYLYLIRLNRLFVPEKVLRISGEKWTDSIIKGKRFPKDEFTYKSIKYKTEDITHEIKTELNF